jgi:poly(3-hydroxybutyrate) depolymerase
MVSSTVVRSVTVALVVALSGCGDDDGTVAGEDAATPPRDLGGPAGDGGPMEDEDLGAADPEDLGVDAFVPGSAGCVDGAGMADGAHTFEVGGMERLYELYLPNGYTGDRPWPLIFALHGNGGSVSYWNRTSGDRNIRGEVEDGAILVVAEAIDNRWRDYDMDSDTWPARIEQELTYFDALVERLTTDLCVDEEAIFSMGFSGGGSFSGVLGCRREYIRGIAVGGSVIYFDEADCVSTPAAWITIGTEELNSGRESYRDFFRERAGCAETTAATDPDPCVAYDGCDADTPVHYCQHPGDHFWPDFGTAAAWAFFQSLIDG